MIAARATQSRVFNELTIDPLIGTITKRSRHTDKLIDEIDYLHALPADLAILFPRVVGSSVDPRDPWLELEYYGYPTLAELLVHETVGPDVWQQIFGHLAELLASVFGRVCRALPDGAVREIYIAKTRRRLAAMHCSPELAALVRHDGPVVINGLPVRNLPELWPAIERAVMQMAVTARATIIHGDLCLSNILYDLRTRICKLIDPRGSFGARGIYGDPRYDVAKLWHSVHGGYDLITNDRFEIAIDGAHVKLALHATEAHREIEQRFARVFFAERGYDRATIQLITGLLFASMPALHYERPDRQLAMYLRALQLFDHAGL